VKIYRDLDAMGIHGRKRYAIGAQRYRDRFYAQGLNSRGRPRKRVPSPFAHIKNRKVRHKLEERERRRKLIEAGLNTRGVCPKYRKRIKLETKWRQFRRGIAAALPDWEQHRNKTTEAYA